jgi:hypothetical protein
MVHLLDLVPGEAGRVLVDMQARLGVTVGYNVKPVAVAPILGHSLLIGREADGPRGSPETFDLDEAQFAALGVQARQIITQILLVDIGYGASGGPLVLHGHAHGNGLGLGVGAQTPDLRLLPLRMRQDENAGNPLDSLEAEGALPLQLLAASLTPGHEGCMEILGLLQIPGRPLHPTLGLLGQPANQPVLPLQKLRE